MSCTHAVSVKRAQIELHIGQWKRLNHRGTDLNITTAIVAAVANPVTATSLDHGRRSRLIAAAPQNALDRFLAMVTSYHFEGQIGRPPSPIAGHFLYQLLKLLNKF